MEQTLKLGKKPAAETRPAFTLVKYGAKLKAAPATGGHYKDVPDWQGMMGNDTLGDCVCAEAGHSTLYFNYIAGVFLDFPTQNVVAMYEAVAGYNPKDPNSDQGTDMVAAAKWRRKVGIKDGNQKPHKIAAYLDMGVGSEAELKQAIYYFGGAGVGFNFPASAMDQFNAGEPWSVVKGSQIQGGHDVWACGYDAKYIYVITWGKVQKMEWAFFQKYADESLIYLSDEMLKQGKSLEGFNATQLAADLAEL